MKTKQKNASSFADYDCHFKVIEIKGAAGGLYIEGMANTIDKDRVGDVVIPKAFEKSLPEYMENPVLLFQHNWDKIVGVVEEAKIIENGLKIRAKISGASDVDDIRTKIREGVLRTLSIGYNEKDADYDEQSKTKVIKDLELLEISVVTIPANSKAKFTAVDDSQETEPSEEKRDDQKSLDESVIKDRVAQLLHTNESLINGVAKYLRNQLKEGESAMKTKTSDASSVTPNTVKQEGEAAPMEAAEGAAEGTPEEGALDQAILDDIVKSKDPMVVLLRGILGELQMLNESMGSGKSASEETDAKAEKPKDEKPVDEMEPKEGEEELSKEPMKSAKRTATKSIDDLSDEEAVIELERVTSELESLQAV